LVLALLSTPATQASLLRTAMDATTGRRREEFRSGNNVRKSRLSRQLFSNPNNVLTSDIDVDRPLVNMASEIHSMLQKSLGETKYSKNTVSLTDDLGGLHLQIAQGEDPCALSGKVLFTTGRVKGLNYDAESLELIPGTEDYEPILDFLGRATGYKWNGVWRATFTADAFKVDVTTQVDADICGRSLDLTTFGGVAVNGTSISAKVFVEGEISNDLSRGDLRIERAQVLSQNVHFDIVASMGGLGLHLPLNYDAEMHSLVEHLLSRNVLQPLTLSHNDDDDAQKQSSKRRRVG
jgi:hypothetical protein